LFLHTPHESQILIYTFSYHRPTVKTKELIILCNTIIIIYILKLNKNSYLSIAEHSMSIYPLLLWKEMGRRREGEKVGKGNGEKVTRIGRERKVIKRMRSKERVKREG